MGDAIGWDHRRVVILAVVVALHLALMAALLLARQELRLGSSAPRAIQLVYLPPTPPSRILPENFRLSRIGSDATISIAAPVIGSLSMAPATSGADGNGAGIDWGAEARRALQAFEIRSNKNPNAPSPSRSTTDDDWWPHAAHHAGEHYKTDGGDWIVWIDSSCYQVAKAASSDALGAVLPQTVCPNQDAKRR
jgi:hypothetical protein